MGETPDVRQSRALPGMANPSFCGPLWRPPSKVERTVSSCELATSDDVQTVVLVLARRGKRRSQGVARRRVLQRRLRFRFCGTVPTSKNPLVR
jgi:hypothetical protein